MPYTQKFLHSPHNPQLNADLFNLVADDDETAHQGIKKSSDQNHRNGASYPLNASDV